MVQAAQAPRLALDELKLPSPPRTLSRIVKAASDPEVTAIELAKIASADPGFTVELLRLINSPRYRRGAAVSTVERAAGLLGPRTLKNLALCTAVKGCMDPKELPGFDLDRFWLDSLRRAVAAQMICEKQDNAPLAPEEAFSLGLLLDLPVLALLQSYPSMSADWFEHHEASPEERRAYEQELFGIRHDDIAMDLAHVWFLPIHLATAMHYHHQPEKAPDEAKALSMLAYRAERFAELLTCANKTRALSRAQSLLRDDLGLSPEVTEAMISEYGDRTHDEAQAFGLSVNEPPSLQVLLMEANRSLAEANLSSEELVQKLTQTLKEKDELAEQLEERNRKLEELSLTDTLTQLPNRRAFRNRLSYEINRAARAGGTLILLVSDIDHFKRVNDTWGHSFGDAVLRGSSDAMSRVLRQTDMVARVGGEEFAVILPATDVKGGALVAEKIRKAVHAVVHEAPKDKPQQFTISIGMAVVTGPQASPYSVSEVEARLYETADRALYAAKEGGRNRVAAVGKSISWES